MRHTSKLAWRLSLTAGTAVLIFLALFAALNASVLAAPEGSNPKILVNEFYRDGNLSTGNEWIEVLLVQDLTAAELESFFIGDSTSSTAAKWAAYHLTGTTTIASSFPKGTLLVIGGDTAFTQDTSYDPQNGDWSIFLNTNGGYILNANGTNNGDLAGTDVVYIDTAATGDTISADGFAVNWDSTPGVLGSNSDVLIPVPSNVTGVVLNSDLAGAITPGNWSSSVAPASLTPGEANGGDNTTYIESLRAAGPTGPELSVEKTVSPDTAVSYQSAITYTVALQNSGAVSDTNVLFTDTLPVSTTFNSWVEQPLGASVANDEITWSGTVTNGEAITFTFIVDQTADYGATITNTAEFSGTASAGTAAAAFTVESLEGDVTFVYHDLEDVVQTGEAIYLAGDFNGWDTTALPMTADAANDVFTATVPALAAGDYGYKYIVYTDTVPTGPAHYDWLNTANRSLTVSGDATVNEYRHVIVGWANLQWPPTLETDAGTATENVYGRLYIQGVTNTPDSAGRGLKAEVGYGSSATPAAWNWFSMSFQGDDGANNDEFVGVMTPTLSGVYSYTTRFDGNWGTGNPNAAWTYGDLNGIPFELSQTGVLTVTFNAPSILINETDADTPGTDTAEFIELFDGGAGNTALDGLVLVFYNGSNDLSYQAFDLDGQSTNADGYFVLCGNAANVANCDLDVSPDSDLVQNGQDAIALYQGNATDFPNGTAVTVANLIDALVYDTDDADDSGLLVLLNPGQPQVNENGGGSGSTQSNQRCPDGSGGARNTDTYAQHAPTPGTENLCGIGIDLSLTATANTAITDEGETITYTLDVANLDTAAFSATGVVVNAYLPDTTTAIESVNNTCGATLTSNTLTWTVGSVLTGTTESCTITAVVRAGTYGTTLVLDAEVAAANETDLDSTPGNLSGAPAEDDEDRVSMDVGVPPVCAIPATHLLHEVQGSGSTSPIVGSSVTVQAVVVGDYQTTLSGFYIQEEAGDQDADPTTSEGVFIYNNSYDVSEGDVVRLQGTVSEFNGLTEIGSVASLNICGTDAITPTAVTLPLASAGDWEWYEGMLISIEDELVVTNNYYLGRFGQVRLSVGERLAQPTNVVLPGAPAIALQELNSRSYVTIDDANPAQNADPVVFPDPQLTFTNTLRGGDLVPGGIVGVVDHYTNDSSDDYRVFPTEEVVFDHVNTRPSTPEDVGGTVKVASFNVLNYFSTIDTGAAICGPSQDMDCRGADSALEFERQRIKIINAIVAMDADVVGLMEMENHFQDAALQNLVQGLNDATAAGTYDYIDTGVIGTDAIKVALIYQPANVTPTGDYAILDSSVDPSFIDTLNRPALIQTFADNASGELVTVAVNHLKSKGSACTGDPDLGDGQGNCNQTRTDAAEALVNYLATDPTGSGVARYLIIGDLNSYAMEDPIQAIEAAGYTNLVALFQGVDAYGYTFDGQWGYLDQALASADLLPLVTGTADWHINADEPIVLDYNLEFKSANQHIILYGEEPYQASDHDPVVIGLNLAGVAPTVSIVSPAEGAVFTSTNGTAVSVPVTITTTDFTMPADGYWRISVDGVPVDGNVTSLSTAVDLLPGEHTLSVELYDADDTPLGITDTVTVMVTVEYTLYLPVILKP